MEIPPEFREEEKPDTSVWGNLTKEAFINAIIEIIKIEPITAKDTAIYRFKLDFEGKRGTIELNVSDFMRSYKKFEELLFSHFDITIPSKLKAKPAEGQPSEWTKFVQLCGKMCTSVSPSESTAWAECDRFLEEVAGFQILEEDRKQEWGAGSGSKFVLLKDTKDGVTYYLLKSSDVTELISQKNLNLLITREQLGSVMKKRGIKRDIDGLKRVGKKLITAWWITEESLIEHGLGAEESKIRVLGGAACDFL